MTTKADKPFSVKRLLKNSPEADSDAVCPFCGCGWFTGVDEHMAGVQGFGGDNYDSYDSEIGSYSYIVCGDCLNLVWYDRDRYRPDTEIDAQITKKTPKWLREQLNSMRLSNIIKGHKS